MSLFVESPADGITNPLMQTSSEPKRSTRPEAQSRTSVVTLQVAAELNYRELATRTVALVCKLATSERHPSDYRAELRHQLVSAVGEAFNNVAIHGYAGRAPGSITLVISFNETLVQVEVRDHGSSFDLEAVAPPDLAALPESGLGLFIIKSFVDELRYKAGSPNVLVMTKYLMPC